MKKSSKQQFSDAVQDLCLLVHEKMHWAHLIPMKEWDPELNRLYETWERARVDVKKYIQKRGES